MTKPLLMTLFALVAMPSLSLAQPTSAEIAGALDDPEGRWEISGESVEVVSWPGATGGTALKLSVPKDGYIRLDRQTGDYAIYRVRYWTQDDNAGLRTQSKPITLNANAQWGLSDWTQSSFYVPGYQINEDSGHETGTRVVYLDGFELQAGLFVEPSTWGCEVEVLPEMLAYLPHEFLELRATPATGYDLFLKWDGISLGEKTALPTIHIAAEDTRNLTAVAAKLYAFDSLELVVPAYYESSSTLPGTVQLEPRVNLFSSSITLRAEGPGFVTFKARSIDSEIASPAGSIGGWSIEDTPTDITMWFGPGHTEYPLSLSGAAELSDFRFDPGYPLEVVVDGEGTVTGVPADGKGSRGETYQLTATPTTGWRFGGWEGAVASSEPTLSLTLVGDAALRARFFREKAAFGLAAQKYGPDWRIEGSGDSTVVQPPSSVQGPWTSSLEWVVEGPGEFSFTYHDLGNRDIYVLLDGTQIQKLERYLPNGPGKFAIDLPPGERTVALATSYPYQQVGSVEGRIYDLAWKYGYPVTIKTLDGGRVEGAPELGAYVSPGTALDLRALPEPQAEFSHWTDPMATVEAELSITVWEPLEMEAIFHEIPASADGWARLLVGANNWTWEEDSWKSPKTLAIGEFARIETDIEGPSYITLSVEQLTDLPYNQLRYGWNGATQGAVVTGESDVFVPENGKDFFVVASPSSAGVLNRYALSFQEVRHLVEISANAGRVDASEEFRQSAVGANPWRGLVPSGATLDYSALAHNGASFARWTGDLEGFSDEGSVVVDRPLNATAHFAANFYPAGGQDWEIDSPDSAFIIPPPHPEESASLCLIGANAGITLSSRVTGPAMLSFGSLWLASTEVKIDGETAELLPGADGEAGYFVPAGEHLVKIGLEIDPTAPEPTYAEIHAGLRYIRIRRGIPLYRIEPSLGGWIVANRQFQTLIPVGDSVTITATPYGGNRFVGWQGRFAGRPASFILKPTEPVFAGAYFEANNRVGGLDWQFSGPRPGYAPYNGESSIQPNLPNPPTEDPEYLQRTRYPFGYLQYKFDAGVSPSSASATTIVSGPGILYVDATWNHREGVDAQFVVDGKSYPTDALPLSLAVGTGSHSVQWEFNLQGDLSSASLFNVGVPTVISRFQIAAEAEGASVTASPVGPFYDYGESVTLTAPAQNGSGLAFSGWWIADSRGAPGQLRPYRMDPILEVEAVQDLQLVARYHHAEFEIEGVSTVSAYFNAWKPSETAGPDGGAAIFTNSFGTLQIGVDQPTTLQFMAKTEGNDAKLTAHRPNGGTIVEIVGTSDWRRLSVFLEAGEYIELSNASSGTSWIADVSVERGWGPTALWWGQGEIDISPTNAHELAAPAVATLSAIGSVDAPFIGWAQSDGTMRREHEIEVVIGSKTLVQPVFGGYTEMAIGPVLIDFPTAWIQTSDTTLSSDHIPTPTGEHRLKASVEGPLVLIVNDNSSDPDPLRSASIDGSRPLEALHSAYYDKGVIQIPPGVHELELALFHTSNKYSPATYSLNAFDGIAQLKRPSPGGVVTRLPDEDVLQLGDTVTYEAKPYLGYEFAGWQPPFSGKPSGFSATLDSIHSPQAIFKPRSHTFETAGIAWNSRGVEVQLSTDANTTGQIAKIDGRAAAKMTIDSQAWLQAQVEGPAVLESKALSQDLSIDGVPYYDSRYISEVASETLLRLGIPGGEHTLRSERFSGSWPLVSRFRPGCLLVARGAGLTVVVSPKLEIYPVGTEVTVAVAEAIAADDFEWRGLPTNAVVTGNTARFMIDDHIRVEALRWEPVKIGGMSALHAGNRDWFVGANDKPTLAQLTNRESDYLAFQPGAAGFLRFALDLPDFSGGNHTLWPEVFLNSAKLATLTRDEYGLSGAARVNSSNDSIIFRITDIDLQANDLSNSLSFERLEFAMEGYNPYLSWWSKYDNLGGAADSLLQPGADIDFDGLPNYIEYLMDTDPLAPAPNLWLEPFAGEFLLRNRLLPDDAPGTLETQFSLTPLGPWENADALLGEPLGEQPETDWLVRPIEQRPTPGEPAYFRLKYEGAVPSLDDLLGD